jgi:hypothetical protein
MGLNYLEQSLIHASISHDIGMDTSVPAAFSYALPPRFDLIRIWRDKAIHL